MKKIAIFALVMIVALLFWGDVIMTSSTPIPQISPREAVEAYDPSLADFENQGSFAGTKVIEEKEGDNTYFAFLTLGSGLPIVSASCYKVDQDGRVEKIGQFPSEEVPNDGNFKSINPMNCQGI